MFNYGAKIKALLATAESLAESSPEAAATYQAKAEQLMRDYRAEEEQALAADAGSVAPIKVEIILSPRPGGMPRHWYGSIFARVADHCGIRAAYSYRDDGALVAFVVGYEGDIRYAELIYTEAYLMFSTRVDPRWDDTLPEEENIWRLRNAGIERRKIADLAWNKGHEASARSKVQRIYVKECAKRGEKPRAAGLSHQTKIYRDAYASSFVRTLGRRLKMARDAADSVGGALTLHGRAERVDEAFYTHFPTMRPQPERSVSVEVDLGEDCERCKKNKSGTCRQHPSARWTKADERRWQARNQSPSAQAGEESGRVAAEGVRIDRTTAPAQRLDPSGRAIEE